MSDDRNSGFPVLMARHNYGVHYFRADTRETWDIGVLRRNGEYRYFWWAGFLDRDVAARIPGARPVKLKVHAYTLRDDIAPTWIDLEPGRHVQGCTIGGEWRAHTFAVLEDGRPRIV